MRIAIGMNVIVVLEKTDGSKEIYFYENVNIVTTAGAIYYAERASGRSIDELTYNFNTMVLGNGTQVIPREGVESYSPKV